MIFPNGIKMNTKVCLIITVSVVSLLISCKKESLPSDEEILVNKWHYDLLGDDFHCFAILVKASMLDPATQELDSLVVKSNDSLLFEISHVLRWKIKPVQTIELFKNMPGRIPWGATDKPVYRKSLPSEMKAFEKLAGKYAGDCSSISNLSAALCRINGVSEDDIFIIRTKEHSVGLVKYNSDLYMFDNTWVEKLSAIEIFLLNRYKVVGFYNDRYYGKKHVWLTKKGLTGSGTLKERIESRYGVKFNDINAVYTPQNIEYLTQVALQEKTTDITDIISASLKGPLFRQICTDYPTPDDIIRWMNDNIDSKPLFSYDSFMTPDQVIVFKTACNTDKAVFLWCYCRYKGIPCEVFKSQGACCLITGGRIFIIQDKVRESDNLPDNSIPKGFTSLNTLLD